MKKIYLLKFLFLVFLFSCENEITELDVQLVAPNEGTFTASLVDGRFHFNNVEDVKTSVDYLKTLEDETVEAMMYEFYEQDFEPLFPFYNENDRTRIQKFVDKKIKRTGLGNTYLKSATNSKSDEPDDDPSDIEQDDDLIGDDYFAAILNIDREVVVNGKLHKYTHNGVFLVDLDKKQDLDSYIVQNNINDLNIPDPNTLERGLVQVTSTIERFAPSFINSQCAPDFSDLNNHQKVGNTQNYNIIYDDVFSSCNTGGGGGGGNNSQSAHTTSMKNYIQGLTPCDFQDGGIFGWNPFGTSKKCFEYHSSKYRTKTKYWNEDLLIYASVGVKVKHQKKRWWWGTKRTDEVALVINQAMFSATYPNQIPPYNSLPISASNNQRLYFFEGRFYNNVNSVISSGWVPPADRIPKTPFSDDIIIQEYIDLPILRNIDDIEIEAKELNKLFWDQGVWNGAKQLMNSLRNKDPKKITYILTTPQKVYINYVDIEQRRSNAKKNVDVLDYDWGGEIKLKWGIKNGNWTSNIDDWQNPLTYFEAFNFTELTDFDTLSMDFVGLTRKGDGWKGSRIVYQKNQ